VALEAKLKHLEILQGVINRMAGNSFLLRGWSVTLASALFALAAKDANFKLIVLAYYPILIFWILDGYFLSQERLFRALFNKVRQLPEDQIDFSMDTREFYGGRNSWSAAALSKTVVIFYLSVLIVMLAVAFYLRQPSPTPPPKCCIAAIAHLW
jgi:hypothetical protein